MVSIQQVRLAQSVEHQTFNLSECGFETHCGQEFFNLYFIAFDVLLTGRLVPRKWNQAWRPFEVCRCIEREKVNFKSREVKRLKECALALILNVSLSTHYSGWMSCLISFVWSSPGCEQRSVSENFKMIIYASAGNRTRDPLLSSVSL